MVNKSNSTQDSRGIEFPLALLPDTGKVWIESKHHSFKGPIAVKDLQKWTLEKLKRYRFFYLKGGKKLDDARTFYLHSTQAWELKEAVHKTAIDLEKSEERILKSLNRLDIIDSGYLSKK